MVTNVITKCNGKDKVVDFRDKLSRSLPDEYAMMHQSGGKKNGGKTFPSVIEMVICDFTKGTGDKSVTCSVNIDPTMFDEWLTVCRCNVGTMAVPLIGRVAKDAQKPWETVSAVAVPGAEFPAVLETSQSNSCVRFHMRKGQLCPVSAVKMLPGEAVRLRQSRTRTFTERERAPPPRGGGQPVLSSAAITVLSAAA